MSRGTVKWDERKGSMTLYSGTRVPWGLPCAQRSEWPVEEEDVKHCLDYRTGLPDEQPRMIWSRAAE